jgi:hypothetical protein
VGPRAGSPTLAKAFTCSDLRPNWMKAATGYQSSPVTMGGAMDDLEIPCPLEPGEYEYEIWLFSGSMGDSAAMDDPQSRMQGKIVVQWRDRIRSNDRRKEIAHATAFWMDRSPGPGWVKSTDEHADQPTSIIVGS